MTEKQPLYILGLPILLVFQLSSHWLAHQMGAGEAPMFIIASYAGYIAAFVTLWLEKRSNGKSETGN